MSSPSRSASSPAPAESDLALVRAALRREPDALARFGERMRCVPRMLAVRNARAGRRLTETELEDLAADVVAAVWIKLAAFDGRARLETWVYQFCYLEFVRRLRSLRSRPRPVDLPADELAAPLQPAAVEYEHLHESLAQLPPKQADTLRLKHFEDLTFEQIGARLDVSPNTVKTRYYRALDNLRARLADPPSGSGELGVEGRPARAQRRGAPGHGRFPCLRTLPVS